MPVPDPRKARTTTERPHTFGWHAEQAGALADRVWRGGGLDVLRAIARAQINLRPCMTKDVPRPSCDISDRAALPRRLAEMGLVSIKAEPKAESAEFYTLTDEGWKFVGGKPVWME